MNNTARKFFYATLFLHLIFPLASSAQEEQKEKKVDLERFQAGMRYGLAFKKYYMPTANFVIYYNGSITTDKYASKVKTYFEYAWDVLTTKMGYKVPEELAEYKLPIYIVKKVPNTGGGQASTRKFGLLPCIEIENNAAEDELKVLSSHELFHIFQNGYDEEEDTWLKEATSVWIEDEIYDESLPGLGYIRDELLWQKHWSSINISLYDMRGKFAYGSAIFLKYLTEHHPRGRDLIRDLWEKCAETKGPNSLAALRLAMGDIGPDFSFLKDYFADFTAAVVTKTEPAPYNFERAGEIKGDISSRLSIDEWYYLVYVSGRVETSREFPLKGLSAMYFAIQPPGELYQKSNLYIGINTTRNTPLSFKVVKHLGSMLKGKYEVDEIKFENGKPYGMIKVPDFARDIDSVYKVTLAVGNSSISESLDTFEFCTAVGEPPYVKEIKVWRDDFKELIYHAKWERAESGRSLQVLKNNADLEKKANVIKDIDVNITFSRDVAEEPPVRVKLNTREIKKSGGSKLKYVWEGRLRALPVENKDSLQIEIDASDAGGAGLDTDPATESFFKWGEARQNWIWENHEDGKDTLHVINLKSKEERPSEIKGVIIRSIPGGVLVKDGAVETYEWDLAADFATEGDILAVEVAFASEEGKNAALHFGPRPPFKDYALRKSEWYPSSDSSGNYLWEGKFILPEGGKFSALKGAHTLSISLPSKKGEQTFTGWRFKVDLKEVPPRQMDSILSKQDLEAIKPGVKFSTIPENSTEPGSTFWRGYKGQTGYFYFAWDLREKLAEGTIYNPNYTLDGNLSIHLFPDKKLASDFFYDILPFDSADQKSEAKEKFEKKWEDAANLSGSFDRAVTWRIVFLPHGAPRPEDVSIVIWQDSPGGPYDRYLPDYDLKCLKGRYVIDANLRFIGDMGTFARQLHGKMIREILEEVVRKAASKL